MTAWLLTWLWQGGALAASVGSALRCAPRLNAATRYLIWCAALAAVAWLGWSSAPNRALAVAPPSAAEPIYIPSAPGFVISAFLGMWAAIGLVRLLRVLSALRGVYAARDRCRPFPSDIESRLPLWLEAKQRGRRTSLLIGEELSGATVLGFYRPCIAIPASLVVALTADELDQVILHEYAHVQRRDDWARLAQTLLLSVVWIHPAALFASRALNREREMACDEWVVARTGLPKAYARCLAHAADAGARMRRSPALVPALIGSSNELLRRVDRVLAINGKARRQVSFAAAAAAVFVMVLISAQLQTMRRFSELVEIALPPVSRARIWSDTTTIAIPDATFLPLSDTSSSPLVPDATTAPLTPDVALASTAPIAPGAPLTPTVTNLAARTFPGAYSLPDAPADAAVERSNRWQPLAAPGVEIALSAKKTGLGLASAFSRAGIALARSF